MLDMWHLLLSMAALVGLAQGGCRRANWWSSFDKAGESRCAGGSEYINGFYRNDKGSSDGIGRLEEAECCTPSSPWYNDYTQVMYADWRYQLDHNNRWATCPGGYFLHGLDLSKGTGLHNIEYARCKKPASHPASYGHCYDQDISACFNSKNICKCNAGYFVIGLYRGGCDSLYCLETLKCCKPAEKPLDIDEPFKARIRVMDNTMDNLALLAHYLGYGWCASCKSAFVGEDFRKEGYTWVADKTGECKGYMADKRLSIAYGDWSFGMKDIRFGTPVVEDLVPESIDSGRLINNDKTPATKTISRSEKSVRSVTHKTTSAWKAGHKLGVEISYSPPKATGGVGAKASYGFSYEDSSSTSDSTNNQQSKTFTVSTSKTLEPFSEIEWSLMLSKTRSTMSYTATILMKFSAELRGFLRWGGGYSGDSTNYHYKHRGSGGRPNFNYKFGDANTPFYTALQRKVDNNARPWQWNDMKNRYSYASSLISQLANENRYTFQLTGKFEDVIGKHCEFTWGPKKTKGKRDDVTAGNDDESHKNLMQIATAGLHDAPAPTPDPPIVVIEVPPEAEHDLVPPKGE